MTLFIIKGSALKCTASTFSGLNTSYYSISKITNALYILPTGGVGIIHSGKNVEIHPHRVEQQ